MNFTLYISNQKVGKKVTAFKYMHDSFARVFNNNQPCDSNSCPCQNLGDWWNNKTASGTALLDAATNWYNSKDSWTNAFMDNSNSDSPYHSIFADHDKVVAGLFPGLVGSGGNAQVQANNATSLINQITPNSFRQLGDTLCQSPLAVRTYLWVIFDANSANTGNGNNPGSNDFVLPTNPNLATLLKDPTKMVQLKME